MSSEIDGHTHCLNCGNEYMTDYEYEFNLCTDCISDATTKLMSESDNYLKWIEL